MISQYAAVSIVIIMALSNSISVIAQSQNETNETDIGVNQNVSGNVSGFGITRSYGPRAVEDSTTVMSDQEITLNETENLNATES